MEPLDPILLERLEKRYREVLAAQIAYSFEPHTGVFGRRGDVIIANAEQGAQGSSPVTYQT
jgi:hypothetical protein